MPSATRAKFAIVAVLINGVALSCAALLVTFIQIRQRWILDWFVFLFCSTLHFWYQRRQTRGWKWVVVLPSAIVNFMLFLGTVVWITGDSI